MGQVHYVSVTEETHEAQVLERTFVIKQLRKPAVCTGHTSSHSQRESPGEAEAMGGEATA